MSKKSQKKKDKARQDKKPAQPPAREYAAIIFLKDIYKRYGNIASIVILCALCAMYIICNNSVLYFEGGDNAIYLFLAKALASGKGYRDIYLAGAPVHTQFPPLFPLILSLIIRVHGADMYLMKMVVSASSAVTIALSYFLLRRRSFALPLAAVIWLACLYRFFDYCDLLLTEAVFMAFSVAALLFFDRWREKGNWVDAALLILSCWAAELTRTAGLPLAAAVGVAVFLHGGRSKKSAVKALITVLLCILPVFLWGVREAMTATEKYGYVSQLLAVDPYDPTKGIIGPIDLIRRFFGNVHAYFIDTAGLLEADKNIIPPKLEVFVAGFFWLLFFLGIIRRLRKDLSAIEIYTIFFLGMASIWPFIHHRYILPVYGFILAYVLEGMVYVVELLSPKSPVLKRAAILIFSVLYLAEISANAYHSILYHIQEMDYFKTSKVKIDEGLYVLCPWPVYSRILEASLWLKNNGAPGAIVMARKPSLTALASGHVVQPCPLVVPDDPKKWLKEKGVRYILVDEAFPDTNRFMNVMTNRGKDMRGLNVLLTDKYTSLVEVTPELFSQ